MSRDYEFFKYSASFGKYLDWLVRTNQSLGEKTYVHFKCWEPDGKYHLLDDKVVSDDFEDFIQKAKRYMDRVMY